MNVEYKTFNMSKRKLESQDVVSTKKIKSSEEDQVKIIEPKWKNFELLAEETNISQKTARSLIKLFEDGNTIPFIARYRRNLVGNMSPTELSVVRSQYEDICSLESKFQTIVKNIEKAGCLNNTVKKSLVSVKSMEELEHVYAPFKPENKQSLAEKSKVLGLDKPAFNILNNVCPENLQNYVQSGKKGLESVDDIEKGIRCILSSFIAHDNEVLSFARKLRTDHYFMIESKHAVSQEKTKTPKSKTYTGSKDALKYETYFDFKISSNNIKPHQILAINRGESQKVLNVKIEVPDFIFSKYNHFCINKFLKGPGSMERSRLVKLSIKDSFDKMIKIIIKREIRSNLKKKAEKAAMEQFSKNLKQLLLMIPVKGKAILGIDPGFAKGCKLALISETGSLLDHNVIYPTKRDKMEEAENVLTTMLREYKCDLIALGNGKGGRETESWLSELIKKKAFFPLEVGYTVVLEDGASVYSCSPEAQKEFPILDPNIISAVSLARRLQDPLAELVKVDPQHLGVGMYQHDMKKKLLKEALSEVVSECVSFVGVDLNTASQCLLKGIAGLTDKRAAQIIEHREENGPFTHRKELLKIKGIGERTFQQCAGFLRVGPITLQEENSFYRDSNTTKLDRTIIHPESYDVARKLLKKIKLKEDNIGSNEFIVKVNSILPTLNISELSNEFETDDEVLKLILDALGKPLNYDLRSEYNFKPLFKKGVTRIEDLEVGATLSGRVNNVTTFGSFVDIGVNVDGLIHVSGLKGRSLGIGDLVNVKIRNVDVGRKRIGLELESIQ
ncbi:hypothetical protein HHI36_007348 [Cryptolaemus montrouzieri]|uniref:S1 motif domain-containing protein n=1 Tax=Cryptolaemus montrouzieri TaxID=559131 RepID=A0ABD2MPA3_9CUCU